MKSIIRRPSQALPERTPKKLSPLGGWTPVNAADAAPVSEFESPKLMIAGKWQFLEAEAAIVGFEESVSAIKTQTLKTMASIGIVFCSMLAKKESEEQKKRILIEIK